MRVMIVEDEPIFAILLEDLVSDEGHVVVGVAHTRRRALEVVVETKPELAFVDVRLADGPTGPAIAADLSERDVTAVFLTGSPELLPDDVAGAFGAVFKPYSEHDLRLVLGFVAAAMADGALPPPPRALTLAPGRLADPDGQFRIPMTA